MYLASQLLTGSGNDASSYTRLSCSSDFTHQLVSSTGPPPLSYIYGTAYHPYASWQATEANAKSSMRQVCSQI